MATKNVGMRIRVEEELRGNFQTVCSAQGKAAAEVLRDFMREYSMVHRHDQQGDLFSDGTAGQHIDKVRGRGV
jgi:hypothetical protein